MKKIFYSVAIAALTVLSCASSVSDEELLEKYQSDYQALMDSYSENMSALSEDLSLTEEEKDIQMETLYEETMEKMCGNALKLINDNPSSPVVIDILKDTYYYFDPEVLSEILDSISDSLQQNEFVTMIKSGLAAKSNTAEGKMFTDFTIVQDPDNAEATTVKFSDYVGKGKYILVDFWASWCGPCKGEIPNLKEIYEKFKGDDFDMLSIAVWDEPAASVDTAAAYGIKWNHIINAQKIPTDIYGIDGIPHIILFGPDGKILKRDLRGAAIGEEISKYVGTK